MGLQEKQGLWHFSSDRDTQLRPAAKTLRVALRGRLHTQTLTCDVRSFHSSPPKATHGRGGQNRRIFKYLPLSLGRQDSYCLLNLS